MTVVSAPSTLDSNGSPPERGRPSGISAVAWTPNGDMEYRSWVLEGRRIGAMGRASQWWVGDWIRYGTSRWGEKYSEAARITGYDAASLRNMAWVASRFDLSLRSDKLTWSHHVLLAPLEPDEHRYWLERTARERLSVSDLRVELRSARRGHSSSSLQAESANVSGEVAVLICPQCGHEIRTVPQA